MDNYITTTGVCRKCGAHVRNIKGKRHSREALATIHADTCPGLHRRKAGK